MSINDLEIWFKNFILRFREEYNKLNENEIKNIDLLDNLNSQLQVNDFWFHNSAFNIDLHIILFTKWAETKGLEINIYG